MEFYAREAIRYAGEQPITRIEGEHNQLVYLRWASARSFRRGTFPRHLRGNDDRRAVSGNCVILKPSSDSPWVAYRFFALLEESGMPPRGELPQRRRRRDGRSAHPAPADPVHLVHGIEGSRSAHQRGSAKLARARSGSSASSRRWRQGLDHRRPRGGGPRRRGRRDRRAAFGFQGQKCSACSRAIIDEAVYDRIVR